MEYLCQENVHKLFMGREYSTETKKLSGQTNHTKKHTEYGQRAFLFENIPTYFIYTLKKKKKNSPE